MVDGERKLLDRVGKRLTKAGARRVARRSKVAEVLGEERSCPEGPKHAKDSVQQLLQHRLSTLVTELRTRDPLVREGLPEGVHSMRVAIRRLRSVAGHGPALLGSGPSRTRFATSWPGSRMRWARSATRRSDGPGSTRLSTPWSRTVPEVDWEPDRVRSALWSPLVEDHERALVVLDDVLTSKRYALLLDRLRGLAAEPPWTAKASKSIRGAYRRRTSSRAGPRPSAAWTRRSTRCTHDRRARRRPARGPQGCQAGSLRRRAPPPGLWHRRGDPHQTTEEAAVRAGTSPRHRRHPRLPPRRSPTRADRPSTRQPC
jgi:hypothetical protein